LNGQTAHALDTVTAKLSFERGVEQYMIELTLTFALQTEFITIPAT